MSRFNLLARFEPTPGQHRAKPIRNGLILLGLIVLVLYSGFTRSIPFLSKDGDTVTAHFDRATNVIKGNLVRVNGVDVGEVTGVERDPSGRGALVKMRVREEGFKLHTDATAGLYWRTLLARNMYIELTPGSNDMPELGDRTIPLARTQSQVEFDELLDSYEEDSRRGVRLFFKEGEKALDGQQVGEAVDRLDPALTPVTPAMQALRGTRPGNDLPDLARSAGKTLAALSEDEAALGGLVDRADMVLGVTAARRADLAAMLQRAPQTMRETRTTLGRLRTTLDILDPVAADLRPGLRDVSPAINRTTVALRALSALTPKALPALRDLRPALTDLAAASRQGTPTFAALQPTLKRLQDEILPFLDKTDANTKLKNYEAIGPFFAGLASISQQFDANGHVNRFMPGQGFDSVGALPCSLSVGDPEAAQLVKCKNAATKMLPSLLMGLTPEASRTIAAARKGAR
ncbi:MAG: Virulence factor Mce family protein [Solirubrobacterales bacterium]|nr:Virulence factor Mce family protein [Solirubrobacterales bacterium]